MLVSVYAWIPYNYLYMHYAVLVLQQLVSGQQCGTVGRVGSIRTGNNMGNRAENEFYIDRGNRAGCAGMITSLSYCFHRPPLTVPVANEYLTTVAVYRPASTCTDQRVPIQMRIYLMLFLHRSQYKSQLQSFKLK